MMCRAWCPSLNRHLPIVSALLAVYPSARDPGRRERPPAEALGLAEHTPGSGDRHSSLWSWLCSRSVSNPGHGPHCVPLHLGFSRRTATTGVHQTARTVESTVWHLQTREVAATRFAFTSLPRPSSAGVAPSVCSGGGSY